MTDKVESSRNPSGVSGWGHVGALAAGVIASFGLAPYSLRPMLWAGLILLFWVLRSGTAGTAAKRGGLFGLGYFSCGVYWIYDSLYLYAEAPAWLSVGMAAALAVYLSLYPMLAAALAARLFPEGAGRLTGAAVLIAAAEWARGMVLGGFPWVLIGQGSLDSPWAGYLPLLGVHATGLMLLLSAAWVAAWLRRPISRHIAWLGAAALVAATGEALRPIVWSTPSGEPVAVALIQPNLSQEMRWKPDLVNTIKRTYRDLTRQVANVPLIVWPEAAIPKYLHNIEPFYREITSQVLGAETTLVAGAFYRDRDRSSLRNGLVNFKTDQRYGKRQLVPFGEFTPLADWLGPLYARMNIRMQKLKPSRNRPLVQVRNRPVGVMICYESIYPEIARQSLPDAAYLINISNDTWFGNTRGPWQHLEASRLRAAETSRELLRASTIGVSAFLGADGSIRAAAPLFTQTILEGEVQPRAGITPYVRFGEWPFAVLSLLAFALCLLATRKHGA